MLDPHFIHDNLDIVKEALYSKNALIDIDAFCALDQQRKQLIQKIDSLRNKKNQANEEIKRLLAQKENPAPKIEEMKKIASEIDSLEKEFKQIKADFDRQLLEFPNVPHSSVPAGDISKNVLVKKWGEIRKFDFPLLNHVDLAEHLDIISFKQAAKLTGSNFVLFKGYGAKMTRALINFMLDLHTKNNKY
ncbi:MAG: serine--tRNA ligase, partial [Candidatus Omnitrophota bacterium]